MKIRKKKLINEIAKFELNIHAKVLQLYRQSICTQGQDFQ